MIENLGDLRFEPWARQTPRFDMAALAVADLDDDRAPEIACFGRDVFDSTETPRFRILENGGDASFRRAREIPGLTDVTSSAFADVDADGDLDLIVGGKLFVDVRWNDGRGLFVRSTRVLSAISGQAGDLHATDLDRDGDLDLVVQFERLSSLRPLVFRNDQGRFTHVPLTTRHVGFTGATSADFDNDGDVDILLFGGFLRLWRNDGKFNFTETRIGSDRCFSACPLDFDGDGDMDLAALVDGSRLVVYENRDGLSGRWQTRSTGRIVRAGDLDGNGTIDLYVDASSSGGSPRDERAFLGDGRGNFTERKIVSTDDIIVDRFRTPQRVFLIDADDDGDLNILSGSAGQSLRFARSLRLQLTPLRLARTGRTLTLDMRGDAASPWLLLAGSRPRALALPGLGTLRLRDDVFVLDAGLHDRSGVTKLDLRVPDDASLRGALLGTQIFGFAGNRSPRLGNLAELRVR